MNELEALQARAEQAERERDEMKPAWKRLVFLAREQGISVRGVLEDASRFSAEREARIRAEAERDAEKAARERAEARIEQLESARDEAQSELARVQALPDLEWAQVTAAITQGFVLQARTDQPAARRMVEALDQGKVYVVHLRARAERAEADNAALLHLLGEYVTGAWTWEMFQHVKAQVSKPHPGSALLERLRALDVVWQEVRSIYEDCAQSGPLADAPVVDRETARARLDALKEKA